MLPNYRIVDVFLETTLLLTQRRQDDNGAENSKSLVELLHHGKSVLEALLFGPGCDYSFSTAAVLDLVRRAL